MGGSKLSIAVLFVAVLLVSYVIIASRREPRQPLVEKPVDVLPEDTGVPLAGVARTMITDLEKRLKTVQGELAEVQRLLAEQNATVPSVVTSGVDRERPTTHPWLIIAIGTVARPVVAGESTQYLRESLAALAEALPADPLDPLHGQIQIHVMDHSLPGQLHAVLDKAKREYSEHPCACFHFTSNSYPHQDATPDLRDEGGKVPGWKVRKQTRDIATIAQHLLGQSSYIMFMEDDFIVCRPFFRYIHYLIQKSYLVAADWISMRVSYGFNGYLLHNNEDLAFFAEYLLKNQRRRPPDHLLTEFHAKETEESRQYFGKRAHHMTSKYNLLHHLGVKSSLHKHDQVNFPVCYTVMTGFVFEVDEWKGHQCGHDDISPCLPKDSEIWKANPPLDHLDTTKYSPARKVLPD